MVKYQRGEDLVQVSMRFPRALWKKLRLRAVRDDTTVTNILVSLAEERLAKKPREKKSSD
jgi:hypothetical protein